MSRKDANHARSDVDKYRKQLGKQEFKGRNKRNTLAIRNRAQARKDETPLMVRKVPKSSGLGTALLKLEIIYLLMQSGLLLIGIIVMLLTLGYMFFWFATAK